MRIYEMNDCGCNAGLSCLTHRFEGRIGTGNSADSDITAENDDMSDKMTDEEMAKAQEALTEIWSHSLSPVTQAEKIERDILDELSTLRQKVADMETAKAFSAEIFDNIVKRLGQTEDVVQKIGKLFERVLELQES